TYAGLEDLLLVDSFVLRAETPGGLIAGEKKQRRLVADFLNSDSHWENKKKRQDIIDSSQKNGDLRQRKVRIQIFLIRILRSFIQKPWVVSIF
ncbi:MAG: hypothetical protein D3922_15380, partial [Candidatus Electrothrix sp. AR1]|nr:hypothetical protein [Candidatus Electrothrix sp. AR1]